MAKRVRFVLAAAVGAATLVGGGSASADPRQMFMTAPYAAGDSGASCSVNVGLLGTCDETAATADAPTGAFRVSVSAKSLNEAQYPSLILGNGFAELHAVNVRTAAAPAVLYVATLSLSELSAAEEGTVVPAVSTAVIRARIELTHSACAACRGAAELDLTSAAEPKEPGTIRLPAMLFNPSGEGIPAGDIKAKIVIETNLLFVGAGTVHTTVAGTLDQVEAAAPSAERTLTAPYNAANAERSCSGSTGTTFTCRSAAARSTGRIAMDLEVVSPVAGTAPGSGDATGNASVGVDDAAGEVRAVVYLLDLRVTSADAYRPESRTPLIGSATGALGAVTSLVARDCTGCATNSASEALVDAVERPFRLDDAVPFVVWMTTDGVPQTPAGSIDLRISGGASLGDTAGQALVRLEATVASVKAFEIA